VCGSIRYFGSDAGRNAIEHFHGLLSGSLSRRLVCIDVDAGNLADSEFADVGGIHGNCARKLALQRYVVGLVVSAPVIQGSVVAPREPAGVPSEPRATEGELGLSVGAGKAGIPVTVVTGAPLTMGDTFPVFP